jgi:hypothetical protein
MLVLVNEVCHYPRCRRVATAVVLVVYHDGTDPLERFPCTRHHEHARAIARQHRGTAYRLLLRD